MYTQHLMHQLQLFPILFRQLEVGIGLSLKVRYFIAIIHTLNKTVDCLREVIRMYVNTVETYWLKEKNSFKEIEHYLD